MGTIVRPKKFKNQVRRPAWLYPEGTRLILGDTTYEVVRDYSTEDFDTSPEGSGSVGFRTIRSRRYWAAV